jgi:Cdc6-like AAA superfamily ATPase
MSQILSTYQIPNFDKTSTLKVKTAVPPPKLTQKLRRAIANLERQDIGWLDILRAMANIAEQWGDEKVAEVLDARANELKRNRKIIRDL